MRTEEKAKYGAIEIKGASIGPEFALIMHYYPAYSFTNIQSLSDAQLEYLLYWIPYLEGRRQGQIAKLEATILNMTGGKSDKGTPMQPHKSFNMFERLVYYSDLGYQESFSKNALKALKANVDKIPSWAIDLVDWTLVNNS